MFSVKGFCFRNIIERNESENFGASFSVGVTARQNEQVPRLK
jgi:hypothetical protein